MNLPRIRYRHIISSSLTACNFFGEPVCPNVRVHRRYHKLLKEFVTFTMAPILKAIKKIIARKPSEAVPVEDLPSSPTSAAVQVLEQTMLSLQTNARDFCESFTEFVRPHLQDKSQGEIIFLSSILLAVLLFVVIIPAFEARARISEEEEVVQEIAVKRVVDTKFVRSSSGSDSSMETIEESEEEEEEQESEENPVEVGTEVAFTQMAKAELEITKDEQPPENETTSVLDDRAVVEQDGVPEARLGSRHEEPTDETAQNSETASSAELGQEDTKAVAEAASNDEEAKSQSILTEMKCIGETETSMKGEEEQQEDAPLNADDNNTTTTPLPSTTTTTSDDDSALVAPTDTPTSSPPSSPGHRPSFKKKMSFGSFKNPKNNPVRRLSASMRRISSSKSVSSMK